MNHLEVFLRQHAMLHTRAAAGAEFNMAGLFGGLTEEQMRTCPHGLNSVAWTLWHVARVEDACIARTVLGEPQLLDELWTARLGVDEPREGDGMSKAEVAALSAAIDLDGLRAYRDAVGRRTRELVPRLWPDLWHARLTQEEVADRVARGAIPADEADALAARERDGLLWWWAVEHTHYHLGQASMLRGLLTQ